MYFFIWLVAAISICEARIELNVFESKPKIKASENHVLRKRDIHHYLRKGEWPKNDSVALFKFMNGEYYGLINIGSPAQEFRVMWDTMWTDSWLPSSHCALFEIVCQIHRQYNGAKSSSYIANGKKVGGEISGYLSTDTFHICRLVEEPPNYNIYYETSLNSGFQLAHLKLDNQTFVEATHIPFNPYYQYKSDGIIGLGYSPNSTIGAVPFFFNLYKQNVIVDFVFTFYMNRDATTERAGKLILGGRQRTHVKNETITKLNVIDNQWKIAVDKIFLKTNNSEHLVSEKCEAVIDSTTNTISGPADLITEINNMLGAVYIPGIKKYSVNCRTAAKLPSMHIVLNEAEFEIDSKYYVQRMSAVGVEACFSPFVPVSDPKQTDYWELGGAFLMQFYTEFDYNEQAIFIGETVF